MAHFAKVEDGIVREVMVIANEILMDDEGIERESLGAKFCSETFGGEWIQTSYNGNIRDAFAAVGMKYDKIEDKFFHDVIQS